MTWRLAACNNGYLHGAWIDADQDADEIRDEIAASHDFEPEGRFAGKVSIGVEECPLIGVQ
ncbi:antirestriction protein ArdA, partial [Paracoccus simplex]